MMTPEERAILAYGIIDPDYFIDRAIAHGEEDQIAYQLNRLRPRYEAARNKPGYKTAAQKQAEINAKQPPPRNTILDLANDIANNPEALNILKAAINLSP